MSFAWQKRAWPPKKAAFDQTRRSLKENVVVNVPVVNRGANMSDVDPTLLENWP